MKPVGKRHGIAPVQLGGEFTAGAPPDIPDGTVRTLRNYVVRPNRFDGRAPFVGEGLTAEAVTGFAVWNDLTNEVTTTYAYASGSGKIFPKNTNGVGYGTGVSGAGTGLRVQSYANFLGKLYMTFDGGSDGTPTTAAVFDGTTVSTSPFNTAVTARSISAYNERIFLIDPRVSFTLASVGHLGSAATAIAEAYDWTGAHFTLTNVTASTTTNSSGVIECRVMPTTTTASACSILNSNGTVEVAASSSVQYYGWRGDFLNTSAVNTMPITMEWLLSTNIHGTNTAYATGDLLGPLAASDGNNYLYRCTTGGTSAGAAPSFGATINGTTTDGTVTWTNIAAADVAGAGGRIVLSSLEATVNTTSAQPTPVAHQVICAVPPRTNTVILWLRLKFYNTASTSAPASTPIIISRKDGVADGVLSKRNYGQQVTAGDFYFPFFNKESSASATVNLDALIWSGIDDPKTIQAANTFPLTEIPGLGTASAVVNGRLVVFKRRGMWIFKGVADPYEPVLPETPAIQVGCLGPLALDISRDGNLYWIGEEHVYRMNIGSDSQPTEIDTPGMFEEVMSKGSNWVGQENATSVLGQPVLRIDHANKDVWIITQSGKTYIYNIPTQAWSYFDANNGNGSITSAVYDLASHRMLAAFNGLQGTVIPVTFTGSATRFDETSDAKDTIAPNGDQWTITNDLVPKPFELFSPRYIASLKEIGLFHLATIQNGSLSLSYSTDRGATYTTPSAYPLTSWLSSPRIVLPVLVTGPSIMVKISRTGAGGARNWAISKMDATLFVHRGEFPWVQNT